MTSVLGHVIVMFQRVAPQVAGHGRGVPTRRRRLGLVGGGVADAEAPETRQRLEAEYDDRDEYDDH